MFNHIETLRLVLLSLKPAGQNGFEGLMQIALTGITKTNFRLASSGLQFGVDGASLQSSDAVYFEAKRYNGKPNREAVVTKIADLGRLEHVSDRLWILCATCAISAQLASDIETDGHKHGIATAVMDWLPKELPKLAVIVSAIDENILINWIVENAEETIDQDALRTAVLKIREHSDYSDALNKLQSNLSANVISTKNAQINNKSWLEKSLSDETAARVNLGQPINPLEESKFVLKRESLFLDITDMLMANNSVFLLGEEGVGKSWLAAEVMSKHEGIVLFLSAEDFVNITRSDIENLIIRSLITQTGDRDTEPRRKRWQTRVDAWENSPPSDPMIVIIDGINQRPDVEWDRMIVALEFWLSKRSAKCLITCRPRYYQRKLKVGLGNRKSISVPDWTTGERNKILENYGINLDWLDEKASESLLNPRLLDVAISTLPRADMSAWKGLNTERLLFEHIRLSQQNKFEQEAADIISERLSKHASKLLDQCSGVTKLPKLYLEEDTKSVSETRFFRAINGPENKYELIDQGLNLALGFAVVDRIWRNQEDDLDISMFLSKMVEPISTLDRTAEVLLAALTVCALDEVRFDPSIFSSVVDVLADLQNLPEDFFEAFYQALIRHPEVSLNVITTSLLEFSKPTNLDWLVLATFRMQEQADLQTHVSSKISDWLGHVCINAGVQIRKFPSDSDEKYSEEVTKRQGEIDDKIAAFSEGEKQLFLQMTPIDGDCEALYCIALKLLASKSLAQHTGDFIKFKFGLSLNHSIYQARKHFDYVTQFNQSDWAEASACFVLETEWLREKKVSKVGKWALVGMLYATGIEKLCSEAYSISSILRVDQEKFVSWRLIENYCSVDPCDPDTCKPNNVDSTTKKYEIINSEKILDSFGKKQEDRFREDALPSMARFAPKSALNKHLEILDQLKTRTGFPLRQLALCGTEMVPLVDQQLAVFIMHRINDPTIIGGMDDNERRVLRSSLLQFAYHHLSEKQQLAFASSGESSDFLLDLCSLMARASDCELIAQLSKARQEKDENTIFLTLTLIAGTKGGISKDLANELKNHISSSSSIIRASIFQIIYSENTPDLVLLHAQSDWSYKSAESSNSYEAVYGSLVLILAISKEELKLSNTMQRISPSCWYDAVSMLGSNVASMIVDILNQHIELAIKKIDQFGFPAIKVELSQYSGRKSSYISINEVEQNDNTLHSALTESPSDFNAKQKHLHELFKKLNSDLSAEGIRFLIDQVDLEFFKSLDKLHDNILRQWSYTFLSMDDNKMRWFNNLALAIAHALTEIDVELAMKLFKKATCIQPFVTISLGDGLTLEHQAVWSSKADVAIQKFWVNRITSAENDDTIALEVLAAERFGASGFIRDFVEKWFADEAPLSKRYAVTVAGFSNQTNFMKNYLSTENIGQNHLGDSIKKAAYAHERLVWSDHWLEQMLKATTANEYWLAMMLLTRIVDARTDVSQRITSTSNWGKFNPILSRARKKRIKKWSDKRAKTLLGLEKPDPIYLHDLTF